jgi:alpha-glucosidase
MSRWLLSIHSDGSDTFVMPPYPRLNQTVTIRLRVLQKNPIDKLFLRIAPEGEEIFLPMQCDFKDDLFVWYKAKVEMISRVLSYRFKIVCAERSYWYNAAGIFRHVPSDAANFHLLADLERLEWLEQSVFYQIFPDTFCSGKPKSQPWPAGYSYEGRKPVLRNWGENPGEYGKSHSMDFFGGDLSGLRGQIPYFKKLGINALYLTPVFEAPSNHRYDVQDYFRIDPLLGSNEEFAGLVQELHKNRIRVMLDGVFNHTGIACRWFNKEKYYAEPGAYQSLQTPYTEFYTFMRHPEQYSTWLNVSTLPKLNYRSSKLRDMIYRAADSVMKFWLKPPYEVDGWRLDVANMLARQREYQAHLEVFREMRQAVKETKSDAYFMGENFFDGSELLQGDCLDAVMNYFGFTLPVREWLSGFDNQQARSMFAAEELDQQLAEARSRIGWQIALQQYNLLNCHDLPRLRARVNHPAKNDIAAILLMTYLGVPSVFYGDEIGIEGGETCESTRRCMVWEESKWDHKHWQLYRSLIELRRQSPALQRGGFKTLYAQGDVFAYARFYRQEIIVVVVQRGDQEKRAELDLAPAGVAAGQKLRDLLSGRESKTDKDGMLKLALPPYAGMIWRVV